MWLFSASSSVPSTTVVINFIVSVSQQDDRSRSEHVGGVASFGGAGSIACDNELLSRKPISVILRLKDYPRSLSASETANELPGLEPRSEESVPMEPIHAADLRRFNLPERLFLPGYYISAGYASLGPSLVRRLLFHSICSPNSTTTQLGAAS